jgi:hypothetical protein
MAAAESDGATSSQPGGIGATVVLVGAADADATTGGGEAGATGCAAGVVAAAAHPASAKSATKA